MARSGLRRLARRLLPASTRLEMSKSQRSKKVKTEPPDAGEPVSFADRVAQSRRSVGASIMDFKFDKRRVRLLSEVKDMADRATGGVVYWMFREQRVQDNWCLLYAQRLALKRQSPLYVVHCSLPAFLDGCLRQYAFSYQGLEEVVQELQQLNIPFHELQGWPHEVIPPFVASHSIAAVVVDFMPLRCVRSWQQQLVAAVPRDVPVAQVDGHNIVPCWLASTKQEYSARTFRPKVTGLLPQFLTHFPEVARHPHDPVPELKQQAIDFKKIMDGLDVDRSVSHVMQAGATAALATLESFCRREQLAKYAVERNDPTKDSLSGLSPFFHFGQLAPQRAVLEVSRLKQQERASVEAFLEETIVRRELSDNFCHYNDNYDSLTGATDWGRKTLDDHRKDVREYTYSKEQWEQASTHDPLWNAAQKQMVREGKMHGYLRMYWAKKLLEWSVTPEEALALAIHLNDKYSYDGRDPNGYVGCMWSVCGIHDQGWAERKVFGKIRFMNFNGCRRKFDVDPFVRRYK